MRMKALGAIVIFYLLMLVSGCGSSGLALHGRVTLEGQYFQNTQLSVVREGQTADEVKGSLGMPFEVTLTKDLMTWRYFEKYHPKECRSYLFGIALSRRTTTISEAVVTFRNGIVESVRVVW